jgi:hypothetical protein
MGIIRTGTPAANAGEAEAVRRGWKGWRGSLKTGFARSGEDRGREEGEGAAVRISGCIIDSLTYSDHNVTFRNLLGGRRQYGIRPLWPDKDREREYADFYGSLQQDIEANGIKIPVLFWYLNGKYYVRYGASRLYIARRLGLDYVPALVCSYEDIWLPGLHAQYRVESPESVLKALGPILSVGTFEVSHERIDIHNVVPL